MNLFKVPSTEIDRRISVIQTYMKQSGMHGLFIVQRTDLFYFSGTAQDGFLYIPMEGEPLLLIRRYFPRAQSESCLKNIIEIDSLKQVPDEINKHYGHTSQVCGLELDIMPVKEFNFIKDIIPAKEFVDCSNIILQTRMIKSDWEISQMEETAEQSALTFDYMQSAIKPGISEMEFAGMYETFARKLGHGGKLRVRHYQTEGYPWHVLSGENGGKTGLLDSPISGQGTSAAFPCGAGGKLLCKNEPIMVDLGWVLNGYHLDETRMFAIDSMPRRAMDACKASIEIHDAVLGKIQPGVSVGDLFDYSVRIAESLGYADQYLGQPGYKVRFIGHGIGLELIEPPMLAKGRSDKLEPGMTIALEPKMIFPGEFCAGIESVILVTEQLARLISKAPVDIFIC